MNIFFVNQDRIEKGTRKSFSKQILLLPYSILYHAFHQSMAIRLYNFDGKAVTPATNSSIVISYEEKVTTDGQKYKEITSGQPLPAYEEARAYVANQTSGNWRIVGVSPFGSPLPLEELRSYELVHQSNATISIYGQTVSTVKIFEYLGSGGS